jgi:hypothetical protein
MRERERERERERWVGVFCWSLMGSRILRRLSTTRISLVGILREWEKMREKDYEDLGLYVGGGFCGYV